MAELQAIADMLRRHRKDLADMGEITWSRSGETSRLLEKLEELRRRSEHTNRFFDASPSVSDDSGTK